jgi:hypothetical protein
VLSALPVAYFVNGDTGQKQTTEVNWDNKFLDIEEIAVIVPIPDSVIDDAEQPIWDQVMPLIEGAAGRLLDAAVFFGTSAPASWPDDIVTAATAAGNTETVGTETTPRAASSAITRCCCRRSRPTATTRAAASRAHVPRLARQARNSQGDRFAEVNGHAGLGRDRRGRLHVPDARAVPDRIGQALAIPYDPSEFVVGVRQDVTFKVFTEGVVQDNTGAIVYNLMQQDMSALRLVMRVGWQVANTINYDEPDEASRYPAGVLLGGRRRPSRIGAVQSLGGDQRRSRRRVGRGGDPRRRHDHRA